MAAETLLELAEEMHEELGRGQECFEHRDPEVTRRHVVSTLEQSIGRFDEHGHREHLEAFLMLAHKENATLREIIHDQSHCCHLLTMDLLAKSSKPGILRLLLSHLDDFEAPLSVLDVLASRHDAPFAQCLLTKFSKHQGDLSNTSLNRLEECGWVKSFTEHIQRWSDQEQEAAVRVVVASNLERARVFAVVEQVLRRGKPKARRQAVQALIQFTGLESETLLLQALEDRDPGVQVAAIEQIRGRDIPDAMACLMKLLESPHERVRHAVRVNLAEFNMNAFLSAFDVLDTENQSKMASLVKKIDLDSLPCWPGNWNAECARECCVAWRSPN